MWLRSVKLFDSSVYCGRINWASIKKFVEELNGADAKINGNVISSIKDAYSSYDTALEKALN